jgi:hypothetical protein
MNNSICGYDEPIFANISLFMHYVLYSADSTMVLIPHFYSTFSIVSCMIQHSYLKRVFYEICRFLFWHVFIGLGLYKNLWWVLIF